MNSDISRNPWKRLLIKIIVYNILNVIVVCGVGWYFKWSTMFQYGGGIFLGGVFLVVFGVLSLLGYWGSSRDGMYLIARSVSSESSGDRNLRAANESVRQYGFMIQSTVAGILSIVIGSVMQSL